MTSGSDGPQLPTGIYAGLVPIYDAESERLIVMLAYDGERDAGTSAKDGIWRELMKAFQYLADGPGDLDGVIPDSAPEAIRAGIELIVADDLLTEDVLGMLEELGEFCVSRDIQLAVRPATREVMVGRRSTGA